MSAEPDRWRTIRHLLACRSGHRCEICGCTLGPGNEGTAHHRDARGMGGTRRPDIDDLCNLLLLCGGSLAQKCHRWVEDHYEAAVAAGWRVPDGLDPAAAPVVLAGGRRVLLHRTQPLYLPPADGRLYDLDAPVLKNGVLLT